MVTTNDASSSSVSRAKEKLGWAARTTLKELVQEMVEADLAAARKYALVRQNGFKAYAHHE
jgi:GDPmannose 4,6-dehydratase